MAAFKYIGKFYAYVLHKDNNGILSAKVHMSEKQMRKFEKRCGKDHTTGLPGLTVAHQGGGWYYVFTVLDSLHHSVSRFLARLNHWANQVRNYVAMGTHDGVFRRVYQVLCVFGPKPRAENPQPATQTQLSRLIKAYS